MNDVIWWVVFGLTALAGWCWFNWLMMRLWFPVDEPEPKLPDVICLPCKRDDAP